MGDALTHAAPSEIAGWLVAASVALLLIVQIMGADSKPPKWPGG